MDKILKIKMSTTAAGALLFLAAFSGGLIGGSSILADEPSMNAQLKAPVITYVDVESLRKGRG